MSLRVSIPTEKCVRIVPQNILVVPSGVQAKGVVALPDVTQDKSEYVGRYIQNVGQGNLYYAIGASPCTPQYFNGILAPAGSYDSNGYGPGQQFNGTNDPEQVTVYSPTGTTISITIQARREYGQGGGILVANNSGVVQ